MEPHISDFASITERTPLVDELRARIAATGPISFRDFMCEALYHPGFGYYRTSAGVTSRGGDYVTSPEVHSIFGALVGRQLLEMWNVMSCPARFDVVEQGAGRGLLARDILAWAARREPAFSDALRYGIVESSPLLRDEQTRTLRDASLDTRVAWMDALHRGIEGCVLSNELLDAFPVHRVLRRDDALFEVFVDHDGERFVDTLRPLADDRISSYFDALGLLPGESCFAEVNLDAPAWIGGVAASLKRGFVLTFDYGYDAPDLYAPWRRDGTLLCFYRQSVSSDPYQRVGRQDITSSVDFTTLRAAGERSGLATLGFTDQSSFLTRLGVTDGVGAALSEDPSGLEEYFARRNVVMDLIDPGKLGRTKVLLQAKGVPVGPLRGFVDA